MLTPPRSTSPEVSASSSATDVTSRLVFAFEFRRMKRAKRLCVLLLRLDDDCDDVITASSVSLLLDALFLSLLIESVVFFLDFLFFSWFFSTFSLESLPLSLALPLLLAVVVVTALKSSKSNGFTRVDSSFSLVASCERSSSAMRVWREGECVLRCCGSLEVEEMETVEL